MKPISKRTFFLSLLVLVLTRGGFAQTSSLKIQNFQMYKNTQQGEISQFYHTIFKEPRISSYVFSSNPDLTASLSEKIAHQKIETSSGRDTLKSIGSYIRLFFRDNIRSYAIAQVEAAPSSEITLASAPLLTGKANTLAPELKAGSDYIKPGLSVENILNTHIRTNISYHAQEEILEAKLFKQISKTVELELTNTNTFTDDRIKKVLLGLSYRF